jgi:hypothetical protein
LSTLLLQWYAEYLETKELNLLLGCFLARNADGLEASSANAEKLESFNLPKNGGWLQQCNLFAGASMLETGAGRVEPPEEHFGCRA